LATEEDQQAHFSWTTKYLHEIMALDVLRIIADKLQKSPFLTIMIDETTDISNQEQVTIVIQRIDDKFETHKEFIGLYTVPSIEAECLTGSSKIQ